MLTGLKWIGFIYLSFWFEDLPLNLAGIKDGTRTLDIRKAGDFVGENMFSDEGEYPACVFSSISFFSLCIPPFPHQNVPFL